LKDLLQIWVTTQKEAQRLINHVTKQIETKLLGHPTDPFTIGYTPDTTCLLALPDISNSERNHICKMKLANRTLTKNAPTKNIILDADDASTTSSCLEVADPPHEDGDIMDDIIRSRIEKRARHGSEEIMLASGIVLLYALVIRKVCQGDVGF
jgi:hypothetical protein